VDVGEEAQRRRPPERIDNRGAQIREKDHVAVLHLPEPVAGTVEADPFAHQLLQEPGARRQRNVVEVAGQVDALEVDDLDLLLPDDGIALGQLTLVHLVLRGSNLRAP